MPYTEPEPGRSQVERELTRMMESDIFVRRPSQGALLRGVVKIPLDEGEVTEKRVREVVYAKHDQASSIIRVQIRQSEKTCVEYYSGAGRDDLVQIFLEDWTKPEKARRQAGWNYKPTFAYNLRHKLTGAYIGAWTKMTSGSPEMIPHALVAFSRILKQDREYVDAWLAMGDAYCWIATLILFDKPTERVEALHEAEKCVATPANWPQSPGALMPLGDLYTHLMETLKTPNANPPPRLPQTD